MINCAQLHRLYTLPALLVTVAVGAYPQQSAIEHRAASPNTLRTSTLVDGSVSLEAIPDIVAYEHFFTLLAKAPGAPTPLENERRRSYLQFYFRPNCGSAGTDDRTLSAIQMDRLLELADALMPKVRMIDQKRLAASRLNQKPSQAAALTQEREAAILAAVSSLPAAIDSDGADKVQRHVTQHVKAHIQIVTVQMPMN